MQKTGAGIPRWSGRGEAICWAQVRPRTKAEIGEWILQIEKHRSVTERFLGRAKMGKDDECAQYFQRLLESEATFKGVSVDPEP